MRMITLKNSMMTVDIDTNGAEIRRIIVNGEDRLWNGDPAVWHGTAPVLFPMCGGLRDDKFTHCGKEYTLQKHGFARKMKDTAKEREQTVSAKSTNIQRTNMR